MENTIQPSEVLAISGKEVCRLLSISPVTLWRLAKSKRLVPLDITRRARLYRYQDVLDLLKKK